MLLATKVKLSEGFTESFQHAEKEQTAEMERYLGALTVEHDRLHLQLRDVADKVASSIRNGNTKVRELQTKVAKKLKQEEANRASTSAAAEAEKALLQKRLEEEEKERERIRKIQLEQELTEEQRQLEQQRLEEELAEQMDLREAVKVLLHMYKQKLNSFKETIQQQYVIAIRQRDLELANLKKLLSVVELTKAV